MLTESAMFGRIFIIALAFAFGFSECSQVDYDSWLIEDYALFPTLPIAAPWSENGQCREDSRKLMDNLRNKTFWAITMWDSSAKTESSQLHGNIYQGGNFDQCLSVTEPIKVQYCGVSIRAYVSGSHESEDYFEMDPPPASSVWTKFVNSRKDPSKIPRDIARWGLCVPASCSAGEMLKSIRRHLHGVNAKRDGTIRYVADINPEHCQTTERPDFTLDEIAFWLVTVILILLVLASTGLDFIHPCVNVSKGMKLIESRSRRLLMAFSLRRNVVKLLKVSDSETANKLRTMHTGKSIVMILVIFGHHCGVLFSGGLLNFQAYEQYLRTISSAIFPQGEIMIAVFFATSGFLTCYLLFDNPKKKTFNPFLLIAGRFLRFAPLYYYMIWFHTSAMYRLGSGPVWFAIKPEVEYCKENWWTNVFFINNYVNVDKSCMIHTWFIPCDFHLFVIAVFVALLIKKRERLGVAALTLLLIVSIVIPGILTYTHELKPVLLFYFGNLGSHLRENTTWKYLYVPTHSRATTFFVGFAAAYSIQKLRNTINKISTKWGIPIFTTFLVMGLSPFLYGSLYYDPSRPYNLLESTIFATLRRSLLGFALVIYMTGRYFGALDWLKYLDWKIWLPMSRIMFSVYLVHFYMLVMHVASERIPQYFSTYQIFVSGSGVALLSFVYGLILYLTVELPLKVFFNELIFQRYIDKYNSQGSQPITANHNTDSKHNAEQGPLGSVTFDLPRA